MLTIVERTITENDLIKRGDTVLVGISGGPDSVALFHCLHRLSAMLGFSLAACHLNHHIRGSESDKDAEFTKKLVKHYGIRFYSGNADVMRKKSAGGGSLEEVARNVRYTFYRKTAKKCGAGKIALGHTSDDNVETFLFNMVRGTGLKGLAGIPIKRREGDFVIIRPKFQIMRYLKKEGLQYHIDATNLEPRYTRNKIRLRLLPYLQRNYNVSVSDSIGNTSRYLRDCADYIENEIDRTTNAIVRKLDNGFSIALQDYMQLHPSLRDLLIRELLESRFGTRANDVLLGHIRSLVQRKGKYKVTLPDNVTGVLEYKTIKFTRERGQRISPSIQKLAIPSSVMLSRWNLMVETSFHKLNRLPKDFDSVRREPLGKTWSRIANSEEVSITEYLDADSIGIDEFVIRSKKSGDKYAPLGRGGTCTLKKLLIDEKVPISIRERIPVFAAGGSIIYVPGYRIAESVRITKNTSKAMKLKVTIFPL